MPSISKGTILRGAFGTIFKRMVCIGRSWQCPSCQIQQNCPYPAVFEPSPPSGSERLSRNSDIPRPFVIKPPLDTRTLYTPEDRLEFALVLVGRAVQYLPYFIVSFKELGAIGIGPGRGRYYLEQITAEPDREVVYLGEDNLVRNVPHPLSTKRLLEKAQNLDPLKITLRFLTPTAIKYEDQLALKPEFHQLISRLRDRISSLCAFYTESPWDTDFRGLAERAQAVQITHSTLQWAERTRFSPRQGRSHPQSGFIGEITYEGDLREFLPMLLLGEYIHVGKQTAFGNGWFEVVRTC